MTPKQMQTLLFHRLYMLNLTRRSFLLLSRKITPIIRYVGVIRFVFPSFLT